MDEVVQDSQVSDDVRERGREASSTVRHVVHHVERRGHAGAYRSLQAHPRSTNHADRTLSPKDQLRRAAATLERAARRHVARRPAAADSLRARTVPAVALPPPSRRETWDYGTVAGHWPQPHDVQ